MESKGGTVIDFFGDVIAYLLDPANWTGARGLLTRIWEHVSISAVGILIAGLIALPSAVLLAHRGRGDFLAVSTVNIGRALPSFGVVGVMFPITLSVGFLASPLGYWATLMALVLLAMPPMFVNAFTGVREVDAALVEAARGMGMSERHVLLRVELPLGLPLIMAGVRTAAVGVVATATLGAVVGYGGLGRYIIDGFAQGNDVLIFVGGVFVALLAVAIELAFGLVESATDPFGARRSFRGRANLVQEDGIPVRP